MTELEQRIAALRVGREFAAYERVRREVLRLLALDDADMPGDGAPSEYWREELAGFEYLFDASPLLIEKLRHHSYHVTGLKVYDYRSHKVAAKARFVEKLEALVAAAGGRELLVPEPPMLGGFGHEIGGELFNVDTLKFFEVLIAMERGAVLDEFAGDERKVVWEIGAGLGRLRVRVQDAVSRTSHTSSIDLPPLFLFSGTYLQRSSRTRSCASSDPDADQPMGAGDADFVYRARRRRWHTPARNGWTSRSTWSRSRR